MSVGANRRIFACRSATAGDPGALAAGAAGGGGSSVPHADTTLRADAQMTTVRHLEKAS
jgi:hypothetical protein